MSEIKSTQHPNVEIAVKNFGPIVEATIDLRPLTVLVGPSNTGKTYFATLIYALQRTFEGFSESGLLSPSGLGWFSEIISDLRGSPSTDSTLSEEDLHKLFERLRRRERPFKVSELPKEMRATLHTLITDSEEFGRTIQDKLQSELKNCFDLDSVLALKRLPEEQSNEMTVLVKVSTGSQECWALKMTASELDMTLDRSVNEAMVLLPEGSLIATDSMRFETIVHSRHARGRYYYLPAARSGIMQSHRVIASSLVKRTTRVGLENLPEIPTLSGVIAGFMEKIILYEEDKISNSEMTHLVEALESDVLAGQIRVKPSPSGYPDFRYLPQGVKEEMRMSQTASMVSELAPLVLFLRGFVQPGDTLIIEEPEAHLHPGAQADMAVILARLVRAGVRIIITTHSDWLLEEISNLTLEGLLGEETDELASWLLPDEVGVWHFQKDKPVKEIAFDTREGISPKDFEDVAEGLYNRSVNLQQRFEKKKGEDERKSS